MVVYTLPKTCISFSKLAPPWTINAPVFAPVLLVVLVINTVPGVLKLPTIVLPVTSRFVPIVALVLTVNPSTVKLPLIPKLVNWPVLGVTLPIGVFCIPPSALSVVIAVIDPLLVKSPPVILPVALIVFPNPALLAVILPSK